MIPGASASRNTVKIRGGPAAVIGDAEPPEGSIRAGHCSVESKPDGKAAVTAVDPRARRPVEALTGTT